MLKFHDALTICAPAISQEAAITALSDRQKSRETVKEVIKKLTFNRKLMCQKLDELADFFEYQKPQGAYYILAKYDLDAFNKMNSFDLALKILYETQVITIPGAAFGPTGEGHLRFSFAGLPEEIEEGFERLSEWIKTFKR
jgi:aminotransferase